MSKYSKRQMRKPSAQAALYPPEVLAVAEQFKVNGVTLPLDAIAKFLAAGNGELSLDQTEAAVTEMNRLLAARGVSLTGEKEFTFLDKLDLKAKTRCVRQIVCPNFTYPEYDELGDFHSCKEETLDELCSRSGYTLTQLAAMPEDEIYENIPDATDGYTLEQRVSFCTFERQYKEQAELGYTPAMVRANWEKHGGLKAFLAANGIVRDSAV